MHIQAAVWLLVFGLLFLGIFLYLRGNLHPDGTKGPYHHQQEYKRYRTIGLIVLTIAFMLTWWLYTKEPKVHVFIAE
jgi:cbb3-type cytochrome oxidase subunit 3